MSSKNPTCLGLLLRKTRLDLKVNQEEMALMLSISPSYLSAIENGNRRLSSNITDSIKRILSPHYQQEEIQKAIILSDPKAKIEFEMPSSETKKNFLVFLRSNITAIPDSEIEKLMSRYHEKAASHHQIHAV